MIFATNNNQSALLDNFTPDIHRPNSGLGASSLKHSNSVIDYKPKPAENSSVFDQTIQSIQENIKRFKSKRSRDGNSSIGYIGE